jgi:hypothetical protein
LDDKEWERDKADERKPSEVGMQASATRIAHKLILLIIFDDRISEYVWEYSILILFVVIIPLPVGA